MTDMIECVARAICWAEGSGDWRLYTPNARAAIEAMREPTPGMVAAGELIDGTITASDVYNAMIDAALTEGEG